MPRKRQNRNQSIIYTLMRRSHSKPPNMIALWNWTSMAWRWGRGTLGTKIARRKEIRREFESIENKHCLTNYVSKKIKWQATVTGLSFRLKNTDMENHWKDIQGFEENIIFLISRQSLLRGLPFTIKTANEFTTVWIEICSSYSIQFCYPYGH